MALVTDVLLELEMVAVNMSFQALLLPLQVKFGVVSLGATGSHAAEDSNQMFRH